MTTPAIERLIDALRCFPGIGPKSAQRIVMHLLERDRNGARKVADALNHAVDAVGHCERCRNFSEEPVCRLCNNDRRDQSLLCVVENPADVAAVEQTANYNGVYFVLMGHLSPLDGIGPADIGLDRLAERCEAGEISEIILATGTTLEGEATAHYISEMARKRNIRATRIAYGVPLGGDLEYVDGGTLSHAITSRREV